MVPKMRIKELLPEIRNKKAQCTLIKTVLRRWLSTAPRLAWTLA